MKTIRFADSTVRIGGIGGTPALLREFGVDPGAVLDELELPRTLFDDPDTEIPVASRDRLLVRCVTVTGCHHFGLLVGQRGGLHSLGLVGLLAKQSRNVSEALQSLVAHFHLHAPHATLGLEVDGDVAAFTYDLGLNNAEAAEQVGDGIVAVMYNIVRSLCGTQARPVECDFAHRRPANVRPYRRYLRSPLRFDAERYALVFPARWLERGLPAVDTELKRLLQKQIDALEAVHGEEFPALLRRVLRTSLVAGHGSADQVAALFSIHSRTLHRRLGAFGTTYRELANQCRYEIAQQMLEGTSLDVAQIGAILDYAGASGFTRAFRRWSGTTPAEWRAQHVGHA